MRTLAAALTLTLLAASCSDPAPSTQQQGFLGSASSPTATSEPSAERTPAPLQQTVAAAAPTAAPGGAGGGEATRPTSQPQAITTPAPTSPTAPQAIANTPAPTSAPTPTATSAPAPTATNASPTPVPPTNTPPPPPPPTPVPQPQCDPNYTGACVPPYPPDVNCPDIPVKNFRSIGSDPHGLDRDKDGIACES